MAEKISILFLIMMVLMNNNRLGQQLTQQELQVIREARVRLFAERTASYDNMISTVTAENSLTVESSPGNKSH